MSGKKMDSRDLRKFHHEERCPAHGFISLLSARRLKLMGMCRCDVPMEDKDE